jgi:tetratricopeptide (TPR) repeat protein
MRARFFAAIFLALVCLTSANAQTPDAIFAKANAEYAAGHFRDAIKDYESLVKTNHWSASVFYDLGNAYFRAEDTARAILNYERALALQPSQPEAQANLRLVRDQSRALELPNTWTEDHLAFLTIDQYAIVAAVALWLAILIFAGLYFARRRAVVWSFTAALLCLIGAGAIFAVFALGQGKSSRDLAIVTADKVQARLATAENAGTVLVLPPGSEVKILSTRGDWSYAALPNDLRGWIPAGSAEFVRL